MPNYLSDPVIKRLPAYYRHLKMLERAGETQISSQALAEQMNLTASQIRQDINCFGGIGRQGYGYSVSALKDHIGHVLGLDLEHKMIIIGAGNIGQAVALHGTFERSGFHTVAIFDNDPAKIGTVTKNMTVRSISELKEYISENHVDIAVIAVPMQEAQAIVDELYSCGVKGFWNFAPLDLVLPRDASSYNVHLTEGLEVLSYHMLQKD